MDRSALLPLLSGSDIAALLTDMAVQRFPAGDLSWQKPAAASTRATLGAALRAWKNWLPSRTRRGTADVRAEYEQVWTKPYPDLASKQGRTHVVWDNTVYRIAKFGLNRFYIALVSAALERLQPTRVLDLGCGFGLNTLILAGMHPSMQFVGAELTAMGLARAREVQRGPLPAAFRAFAPGAVRDAEAHRRVTWVQSDAARLPFAGASFDMVISVLALEQMESIRPRVLEELRRVSARTYLGIEPFADWNQAAEKRDYLAGLSYWRGSLADLAAAGFHIDASTDAFPQKLRFGVGLVIASRR